MKVKRTSVRGLAGCFVVFALAAASSAATVHIAGPTEVNVDPGVTVPVEFEIFVDTAVITGADVFDYTLGVSGPGVVFDYPATEAATDAVAPLATYIFPNDGDGAFATSDFGGGGPTTIYASDLSASGDSHDPVGKSLGRFVINVTGGVGYGAHVISGRGNSDIPGFDGGLLGRIADDGFAIPDFAFNVLATPTLTWDGTDPGPWTDAHWAPGPVVPPGHGHMVVNSGTAVVSSDLTATPATSLAIAGTGPAGTVSIESAGTLAVTGGVSVGADGTLSIDGTLIAPAVDISGGSLTGSSGSVGVMTIDGSVEMSDGATLGVECIGSGSDQLASTGSVTLGLNASLDITVQGGGGEFQAGTYLLIDADAVSGTFANVTAMPGYVTGDGLTYDAVAGTVTLTLERDLNPADANLDGQTDVSDRIIWNNNNFTFGTTFVTGDWNNNGATDVSDRIIWNNNNFTFAAAEPGPIAAEASDADDTGPNFVYDVDSGIMRVMPNGHFITDMVVPAPEGASLLPDGLSFNSRGDFVLWQGQNFRGSFQAYDGASNGGDGVFDLARFPLGLTHADFGQVHWGALPIPGEPGIDGFSDVIIIPEPATMALLALGGLAALRRRRRQ